MLPNTLYQQAVCSAYFLAVISVGSPWKLFIFAIYKYIFSGSKYPKNNLFYFENRSTGCLLLLAYDGLSWVNIDITASGLATTMTCHRGVCRWMSSTCIGKEVSWRIHREHLHRTYGVLVTRGSWALLILLVCDLMYLFTTVLHPHGHWQLQELLGNQCYHYHYLICLLLHLVLRLLPPLFYRSSCKKHQDQSRSGCRPRCKRKK